MRRHARVCHSRALRRSASREACRGWHLRRTAVLRRRDLLDDALTQGLCLRHHRWPRVPASGEDALARGGDMRALRVQQSG